MKKNTTVFLIACLFSFNLFAQTPVQIKTLSGTYEVIIDEPSGNEPFPLLVIAPAKNYTMTGKLFQQLAEGAADLGYFVVRFNWKFVTEKKEPSKDLSQESQDLETVVRYFINHKKVDSRRVIMCAKSFGSKVAMKGGYQLANALLLLTPNCDVTNTFDSLYAPIFSLKKKLHIVISADDPYCNVTQIYSGLSKLGLNTTIHTLAGDHNFELENNASELNVQTAIKSSLNWLNQQK